MPFIIGVGNGFFSFSYRAKYRFLLKREIEKYCLVNGVSVKEMAKMSKDGQLRQDLQHYMEKNLVIKKLFGSTTRIEAAIDDVLMMF